MRLYFKSCLASEDCLLQLYQHIILRNTDVLQHNRQLDFIFAINKAVLRKNSLVRFLNKWLGDLLTCLNVSGSCQEKSFLAILFLPSWLDSGFPTLIKKINDWDKSVKLPLCISERELSRVNKFVQSLELFLWVAWSKVMDTRCHSSKSLIKLRFHLLYIAT